jgi:hypothetical protein
MMPRVWLISSKTRLAAPPDHEKVELLTSKAAHRQAVLDARRR